MKLKIQELRRQREALRVQADQVALKAELSEEDKTGIRSLRSQYDDLGRQIEEFEFWEVEGTRSAQRVPSPTVLRGGRGDSEGNAWRAYLQNGDRGGLRHLMQEGEEGGRPQIVLPVPSQRETRALLEGRSLGEQRAVVDSSMNITTAADGGNLVPTTLVGQIALRKNERMLAERLGCQRVPGVGTTVEYPVEKADPEDMPTTAEQSDAHGNNYERGAFQTDKKQFTLIKKTRRVELTEEMLEDTGVDLMSFIADKIAREVARTHNGLLVAEVEANGTSLKSFASNSAIAAGELEGLLGNDTLGFYLEDAMDVHWVMRTSTHWGIKAILGDQRLYAGMESGLLGYDVFYSNKVDSIAAGGKSVLFGDWNALGYREAPELRFIQDPYTVDGMVILKYSFRTVYGVLQPGAIGYGAHP